MRAEQLPCDGLSRVNFGSLKCPTCCVDKFPLAANGITFVFGYAVCIKDQDGLRRNSDHVVGSTVFRKDPEREVCRRVL